MTGRGRVLPDLAPAHFPPRSAAPILEHYDDELKTIELDYLLPAPLDDRGVVDIFATVEQALSLVDPDYIFPKEHCDVHHFVWERAKYLASRHDGSQIPNQYREVPFHKGYLPRQLHNFIHATVAPPPVPALEVMQERVESYELARRLFSTARLALRFERTPLEKLPLKKRWRRERLLEEDAMREVLRKLQGRYESELDTIPEGTEFIDLHDIRERPITEAATHLGRVAARDSVNLLPYIYANRLAA